MAVKFVKGLYMTEITKSVSIHHQFHTQVKEENSMFPFVIQSIDEIMSSLLFVVDSVKKRY
jgi:hypothetical protein